MPARKSKKAKAAPTSKRIDRKNKKKDDAWTWVDILRTPVLASVGAFSVAEEGIEKFVRDIIERGEASEKEGKKIVEDFRKRTRRNRRDLEKGIDERIEKTLKAFRLPTKKDVVTLEKKIDQLEKKVSTLAKKASQKASQA
jgi:poly(hydroxyalkanoate) granule-associated protein